MPTHSILGGKVKLYRRDDGSEHWYCSTYFQGKNRRKSTKSDSLSHAEEIAEDWFLELRGKSRAGLLDLPTGPTFNQASDIFEEEYEVSTSGERSPRWVAEHKAHLKNHLRPFFGKMGVTQITADTAQQYRIHRSKNPYVRTKKANGAEPDDGKAAPPPKPPARNTLDNEIITLRLVMKIALRKGWITGLPDFSAPYKKQMKVVRRPWFSPEEYKALYTATRDHARAAKSERNRYEAEQLHDYVLFMANTGLRPDEAKNLEHRDIKMVKDDATGDLILLIEVRGKRGTGYCKSRPDAVKPYQRLLNRPKWAPQGRKPRSKKALAAAEARDPAPNDLPQPTDKVFPGNHIKQFNRVLADKKLKFDRDGKPHTFYSLRHYYICQRLMEGADVYQLAKNCRTSVEMIQKHYAVHIANMLDAAAINVKRPRRRKPAPLAGKD
ncbi:MAG: site-specific integrase [Alphaproteobacteria bacterium]|nr:site-specific integrase [Alphaproteobacteria bacterium]